MDNLSHVLSVIGACCGIGAFIDLYIGPAGQKKVRAWLETWWLRMSRVKVGSFGREEALYAIEVMDRLFGPRLLSFRRLKAVIVVAALTLAIYVGIPLILMLINDVDLRYVQILFKGVFWFSFSTSVVFFAISISVTKFAALRAVRVLDKRPRLNFLVFFSLAIFQYVLLCYWRPAMDSLKVGSFGLPSDLWSNIQTMTWTIIHSRKIDELNPLRQMEAISILIVPFTTINDTMIIRSFIATSVFMGFVANLGRLFLTFIFVGSFLTKPLWPPVLTLWLRIIESEKPIFTLVLGGIGGIVAAIATFLKH